MRNHFFTPPDEDRFVFAKLFGLFVARGRAIRLARRIEQEPIETHSNQKPIAPNALTGAGTMGISGHGAKPQPRETLPHAT
jgi:hypothetical protein